MAHGWFAGSAEVLSRSGVHHGRPSPSRSYLFHPPQSAPDRPMLEPSAWTGWVRRLFRRHHGEEVAPKTLRSVFITWLRDATDAPEVLKSAAHAMKHSEARQASADYDQEADDRLVKAAYSFNLNFASQYGIPVTSGAGSSSAHGAAPPVGAPPVRRCNFAACTFEPPTDALRECATCGEPHHHACSIQAGCEDDQSRCAACLGVPIFTPAEAAPAEPEAPLTDEAIAQRLAALDCEWIDPVEQTELRGTIETDVDGVGALLDAMGADACVLHVPDRIYRFQRSEFGERRLNVTSELPERLDGDEWQPLEGGPWVAKLMRPSRQPVASATYRNFCAPRPRRSNGVPSRVPCLL